jgi:hypothetical protein
VDVISLFHMAMAPWMPEGGLLPSGGAQVSWEGWLEGE